jgi:hypothetical protein
VDFDTISSSGVDVVVILPVQARHLARFISDTKAPGQIIDRLFADPSAVIATAAQCNKRFDTRSTFTSPHAQTSVLGATFAGLALGLRTGPQGDPRQQGGAWVLDLNADGSGWISRWSHRDRHNADQVPIPILFAAAGLPATAYVHPRDVSPDAAAAAPRAPDT